jgi:hypothetical protein
MAAYQASSHVCLYAPFALSCRAPCSAYCIIRVEESNGQLTAQYKGNQSGNITVNPFSANAAMQAANGVLVPENEFKHEWNFDSKRFKGLQSGQAHTITNPSRSQIRP